jgi:hypothetical protein
MLYECGKAVLRPQGINSDTLLNMPVRCGSYTLHKLSIGAELWLTDYAMPVCEDDERAVVAATAFASIHSHDLAALAAATDAGIRGTVEDWMLRLDVTMAQLEYALAKVLPASTIVDEFIAYADSRKKARERTIFDDLADDKGETLADAYGPVIALLVRDIGQTPQYWLFDVSHDEALYYMGQVVERLMREAGEKSSIMQPMLRAQRAMMVAVGIIREAHKEPDCE